MSGFLGTLVAVVLYSLANPALAEDWPQWRGTEGAGVVREKGLLKKFPEGGPKVLWRVPINAGYSGPAVVGNRLYVMDREQTRRLQAKPKTLPVLEGTEQILCLDAQTGATNWQHSYDCAYQIDYPSGPRTTPAVVDGRLYTLGAMGDLRCLKADTGELVWAEEFRKGFNLEEPPTWGWAAHPLPSGRNLICLVGGEGSGVVAFDLTSGKESWRALTSKEIGYSPPAVATINGKRQLVVWLTDLLAGIDPENGTVHWSFPYPATGKPQRPEVTVSTPLVYDDHIFVSTFYHGALLLRISNNVPVVVWNRKSTSKSSFNDGLHTIMSTLVYDQGHLFGVCGMGELRCLNAKTGERVWETYDATGGKKGLFANAFLVRYDDGFYIWNDQGELIFAKLSANGYQEVSRTKLLEPTESARGRTVVWSHPAFANGCVYLRNQKELLCASLKG